jgi:Asparagine synthase
VVDSLREAIARVPAGPVICQLSGGLDSRLCLALLAERRRDDVTALTVDPDTPHERDLRMSAQIAETVGVPHEIVVGAPEDYWPQFQTRSLRVDYQFVRSPWRMPKRRRLEEAAAPVVDGFGFDTLAVPGERFLMRDAVAPSGDDAVVKALWARLRAKQAGGTASSLRHSLAQALWTSTRRQFLGESKRFEGHPARAVLTLYWTRQVRGISQTPFAILGNDIPLAMPLIDDSVARSTLAISPASKFGRHLYTAVFEAIEPRLTDLPFTSGGKDAPRDPGRRDRRSQTVDVADAMRAALESGPMADWVRPRGPHLLRRHQRGRPARTSRNLLGPALFNLWHQRYRDVLGEIDLADVIERD